MQLDRDNRVSLLAGHPEEYGDSDGPVTSARFTIVFSVTATESGVLYVTDTHGLRRVQLATDAQACSGVTTIRPLPPAIEGGNLHSVSYDPTAQRMYIAKGGTVYEVHQLSSGRHVVSWACGSEHNSDSDDDEGADAAPEHVDGPCTAARFAYITVSGLMPDGSGGLYILDQSLKGRPSALRHMDSEGTVTTLVPELGSNMIRGTLLANGWLAVYDPSPRTIRLLRPGVDFPSPPSRLPLVQPPSLAADLSHLLDAAPQGSPASGSLAPDVTVRVGGRAFPAHRLILSARCEYFRQLFSGGFAEAGAPEVTLADADPDAFAALLRWAYTGGTTFPPALLRPLAALADRLLLPGLSQAAQAQLLAGATPESVLDGLLWAQERGFGELVSGLKAYYAAHAAEVLRAAPDSVLALMSGAAPQLAFELHAEAVRRAARGP